MTSLKELEHRLYKKIYKDPNFLKCLPSISAYSGSDYKAYLNFSDEKYVKTRVCTNDKFEIYIICWSPGQSSPIHDHAKNGCIMKVLSGSLKETRYDPETTHRHLKKGYSSYIHNSLGYHKIENGKERSVSLHVYSPPNHKTKRIVL
jgi:predicted metal-dependent enzyme (double-stranded beta helix superfamily)